MNGTREEHVRQLQGSSRSLQADALLPFQSHQLLPGALCSPQGSGMGMGGRGGKGSAESPATSAPGASLGHTGSAPVTGL